MAYLCLSIWFLRALPIIVRTFLNWVSHDAAASARLLQKKVSRHLAILTTTVVEFQETQCFFMLANQAAVIVSSSSGAKFLEVESVQQLYANLYLSQIITVAGILPVVLITFRLHRAGMNSWYILILSAITIATSNVALYMNRSTSVTDTFQRLQRLQRFPRKLGKCGFNPPPLVYCVNPIVVWFHDIFNSVSVQLMDIPCLVIYALALIYQVIHTYLSNSMETEDGQLKRFLTLPWVRALRVFVKLVINGYFVMAKCF